MVVTETITKKKEKDFPLEHVDIEIIHSMSRYPGADSAFKGYGLKALERVCEHHRSQRGAAVKRVQKECMLWDFLLVK